MNNSFVSYTAGASPSDKKSLLNELQNMSTMDSHPNIVNLIGAQTKLGKYPIICYVYNNDRIIEYGNLIAF